MPESTLKPYQKDGWLVLSDHPDELEGVIYNGEYIAATPSSTMVVER